MARDRSIFWQAYGPIRFLGLLKPNSQQSIPKVMADFFQDGSMATLHRLGKPNIEQLEQDLLEFSSQAPIALVLPCHVKELGTSALRGIIKELKNIQYVRQIVVGIDGANATNWQRAKRIFSQLPQKPILIWNDGPRMRRLIEQLIESDLDPGPSGKGRNLWLCFGYVLASGKSSMVALHDCDIVTYSRELLARLCYPVAHPNLGFDFCKGYSARFTDKLNGRVMRLLVTPLIRSLQSIIGQHDFLVYLDTFRYPLSGEMSLDHDIIRRARIPSDWGIEVGILAEVFRVSAPKSICQVDIAECYDHKHQELSPRDASRGLNKMAGDIVKSIFVTLAGHGVKLDRGLFDTLLSAYMRKAEDSMRFYAADAEINSLTYDRHQEELAVATFVRSIRNAARDYLGDPLGAPMIANWNRVEAALPDFLDAFRRAVELDGK
jgi:glucosyl-3-phosphoglycerate synthase